MLTFASQSYFNFENNIYKISSTLLIVDIVLLLLLFIIIIGMLNDSMLSLSHEKSILYSTEK